MSDKESASKTKADDVHVSDGLAKLHQVAEALTEEEILRIAEEAKQAAENAKKNPHT